MLYYLATGTCAVHYTALGLHAQYQTTDPLEIQNRSIANRSTLDPRSIAFAHVLKGDFLLHFFESVVGILFLFYQAIFQPLPFSNADFSSTLIFNL